MIEVQYKYNKYSKIYYNRAVLVYIGRLYGCGAVVVMSDGCYGTYGIRNVPV